MLNKLLLTLSLAGAANAHIAAWGPGMYCNFGKDPASTNQNNNDPIGPLYNLKKEDWWFQHERGCDKVPPKEGEFLELPAGGEFTVELANNRAFTSLSYSGTKTSQWPDGGDHPDDWHGDWDGAECLPGGGWMHAQNESMTAGTGWAISYHPLEETTIDNLVVFSVLHQYVFFEYFFFSR